jgi:GntR family transcriptional regulator
LTAAFQLYYCINTIEKQEWKVFYIRPESGEPIYFQLIRQIKHAVRSGILHSGDQMPTVRDLAAQLVINPNTVARAYRELVHEGVLTATQGGGTFVKMEPQPLLRSERERRLEPFIQQLAAEAQVLGISDEDLLRQVKAALNGLKSAAKGRKQGE